MGVISAVGLYILVSIFSSGTESESRWKILVIAVGTGLLQAIVLNLIPGIAGALVAIGLSVGLIIAALTFWCGVERKAALKIAGSYLGLCLAIGILLAVFSGGG